MKVHFTFSVFLLVGSLLLVLSCDRKTVDQSMNSELNSDVLIREAQTYFQTLNANANARSGSTAFKSNAPKDLLASRAPQWEQAVTFTKDGKQIVEVPLLYNNNDPAYSITSETSGIIPEITQKNGVTKALFFKHKDGSIAVYIMKLILDPTYLAKVKNNNQYKNSHLIQSPKILQVFC